MNEFIIPIKGVISSTVKVQAASLEEAIDHALANPPESNFGLADFDGVDEWLLSGGHYVDGEHVAAEPAEEQFAGSLTAERDPVENELTPSQQVAVSALPQLFPGLSGSPVAIVVISNTGDQALAVWGGTMESNIGAMVYASARVGVKTEEWAGNRQKQTN